MPEGVLDGVRSSEELGRNAEHMGGEEEWMCVPLRTRLLQIFRALPFHPYRQPFSRFLEIAGVVVRSCCCSSNASRNAAGEKCLPHTLSVRANEEDEDGE